MALLAGLIGLEFTLLYGIGWVWRRGRLKVAAMALGYGVVVVLLAGTMRWSTSSPFARALESAPSLSSESLRAFVHYELFDRGGPHGSTSVRM